MKQKKQESAIRRFFGSRLFLVILLILALLVALNYARAYYQDYKVRNEIKKLEEEVRALEHKRLESLEILEYVTSDAFLEEAARTELNLKKPGENVMVVTDRESELAEKEVHIEEETYAHLNNPTKWWYYFTRPEKAT